MGLHERKNLLFVRFGKGAFFGCFAAPNSPLNGIPMLVEIKLNVPENILSSLVFVVAKDQGD